MIPYSDFHRLLIAIPDCADLAAYLAEEGGSVPGVDVDVESTIRLLTTLWAMAHEGLTIRSIAAAAGLSVRRIALNYGLPTRTVENWASGTTTPPSWQLPLIAYAVMSDTCGEM